jgi:hypothetical protein
LPKEIRLLGGSPHTAKGELYLVVQVGNSFLSRFPRARVVINKGRYPAIDLTANEIKDIECERACFGFCPVATNTVVFETRERIQRQQVPMIASLVANISESQFRDR